MGTNRVRRQEKKDRKQDSFGKSQHSQNTHEKYQRGGVRDQNGYHNFTLSNAQQKCLETIQNNTITFIEGKAGTGKSLGALYYAAKEYLTNPSMKIIVVRTPMEATLHDKVGFLPDDLKSKLEPHFASTKLLLEELLNPQKVQADMEGPYKRIQFLVPNFVLGATFDNSILIVDEAQTLNPVIMKLLLERIGVNSKMIVMGDPSQVYSSNKDRQGMRDAISKFFTIGEKGVVGEAKFDDIGYYQFSISDCMRSDIVKTVLEAYS